MIVQRGRDKCHDSKPWRITASGTQYNIGDFKEHIRIVGMTHVKTSS